MPFLSFILQEFVVTRGSAGYGCIQFTSMYSSSDVLLQRILRGRKSLIFPFNNRPNSTRRRSKTAKRSG